MTTFGELQDYINKADRSGLPALRLAVLRNVTLEAMEPFWQYEALRGRLSPQVTFGAFDNIYQEAVGGADFIRDADCVLIFCHLEMISPILARNFTSLNSAAIAEETSRLSAFADDVISGVRRQTKALMLWHGFEEPVFPARGILDSQFGEGQRAVIASLNNELRRVLKEKGAYFIDMGLCQSRVGLGFYDQRYWHIGRAPYSRLAGAQIAQEDFKFIRASNGRQRKCLVMDCDNILWGGVVGEDGLEKIHLGKTYPGSCYSEFQERALSLRRQGILLALCSKNEPGDVWRVFREHPDMILKETDITVARINWQDKAANLREIAADLGLGLDSLVFVDDNPVEIGLVQKALPQVETIYCPQARAVENASLLASCGFFDTLGLSEEDRQRGAMYQAEVRRNELKASVGVLEEYFSSLEMGLSIKRADALAIPRLAQLAQKTNQFNLTTMRYTEMALAELCASEMVDVLSARLVDRFGDSGLVGLCVIRSREGRAFIESFLLSCRVIGRGVEDAFLSAAVRLARARGKLEIVGEFLPTDKNAQTRSFYERHSFITAGNSERGGLLFVLPLESKCITPGFIRVECEW